jgi:hypothetical protein
MTSIGTYRLRPAVSFRLAVLLLALACVCCAQLPSITPATLPPATTGGAYTFALYVSGGTPPYSNWKVGAGSIPPGLTLDANTGVISGKPSASGTFNFFVTVEDSNGGISPAAAFTIAASEPGVATVSTDLPTGVLNAAYNFILVPTGGTPPYSNWTVVSGVMPQGLFLDPGTGTITGTPIMLGASTFKVTVQDSAGIVSQPKSLTMVIGVAVTSASLPKGTLTAPYFSQLTAMGGTGIYGWAVTSGVLPPGLTLSSTGLVSGIPAAAGSYSFSITATDTAGAVSSAQPFTVVIAKVPVIITGALPSGLPGIPYTATLRVDGGSSPISWSITSGALPPGLSLLPTTGGISGTPQTAAGTSFDLTVQATDAAGVKTDLQPLTIAITLANLTVSPSSLYFSAMPGDTTQPPVQSASIFCVSAPVTFTATTSGGNWLSVKGGGKTPGSILVSVTSVGLTPGTTYQGSIKIAGQNIAPATIPVTFTIGPSGGPVLSTAPASLTLNYVQGNSTDQRYLIVNNNGNGVIHYSAQATTDTCGPNWLNVMSGPGSATSASPGVVAVLVTPQGLSDRTCTGSITVGDSTSGQSLKVPVTMTVSAQNQSLLLTKTGMSFVATAGGSPASQTFAVMNSGVGIVNWIAIGQTPGGVNWLTVSPSFGNATSGVIPSPVTVSVDSHGLPPGIYKGTVQVASNTVGNSPQSVTAMLTVLDSPPPPPPLAPSGLILIPQTATTSAADSVTITNPWNVALAYSSNVVTDNGTNWLTQTPASGSVAAGATATLTLQANVKGLNSGLLHGVVRVAFVDGTVRAIDVYAIVPPTVIAQPALVPEALVQPDVHPEAVAQACPGNNGIVVVMRSPEPGFVAKAQLPVPLQLIARDCATGRAVRQANGASAQVLIGTKNPATISLVDDGTGVWTGVWIPAAAATQIDLTARVDQYVGAFATVVSGVDYLSGSVDPAPEALLSNVVAVSAEDGDRR